MDADVIEATPNEVAQQGRMLANLAVASLILGVIAATGSLFGLFAGFMLDSGSGASALTGSTSILWVILSVLAIVLGVIGIPTLNRKFSLSGAVLGGISLCVSVIALLAVSAHVRSAERSIFPTPIQQFQPTQGSYQNQFPNTGATGLTEGETGQ